MTQVDAFRGARSGGSYGSTVSVTTGAPFNIASNGSLASGVAGRAVGGGASGTAITVSTAARNGAAGATGLVIVRLIF
jgi:hypothetical protein